MAILDILNSPNLISCKILDAEIDKLTFLMNPNWFHVKSQNLTWYHTSTEIVILTFLMFWMNQNWFHIKKNQNLTWNHALHAKRDVRNGLIRGSSPSSYKSCGACRRRSAALYRKRGNSALQCSSHTRPRIKPECLTIFRVKIVVLTEK